MVQAGRLAAGAPSGYPSARAAAGRRLSTSRDRRTPAADRLSTLGIPMSALICGSLAFDTIMVFPDQFKNHILPDKVTS